jgi:hypothetical protein
MEGINLVSDATATASTKQLRFSKSPVIVPVPNAAYYLACDDRGQLDKLRRLVDRWTPEATGTLSRVLSARAGVITDLERTCSRSIKHPLSDRLGVEQHSDEVLIARFFMECAATQGVRSDLAQKTKFDLDEVLRLAGRRLGLPEQLRTAPVGSIPDRHGRRVSYCSSADVSLGLDVARQLFEAESLDPVLKAVLIYALICQVHPFLDGNGRLARTVCSLLLGGNHSEPIPLMIGALMKLSRGGLLIALREVHFFGNAGSLFRYFSIISQIQQTLLGA